MKTIYQSYGKWENRKNLNYSPLYSDCRIDAFGRTIGQPFFGYYRKMQKQDIDQNNQIRYYCYEDYGNDTIIYKEEGYTSDQSETQIDAYTKYQSDNRFMNITPSYIEFNPVFSQDTDPINYHGGFIDFHFFGSDQYDYTSRIIESEEGKIIIVAKNGIYWRNNSISGVNSIFPLFPIPVGGIIYYSGTHVPDVGYLIANGSEVEKSLFPDLYDAIGDLHGVASQEGKFKLPDLRPYGQGITAALIKY